MVKEPNAVWHNSGRKDCLVSIGYQYKERKCPCMSEQSLSAAGLAKEYKVVRPGADAPEGGGQALLEHARTLPFLIWSGEKGSCDLM